MHSARKYLAHSSLERINKILHSDSPVADRTETTHEKKMKGKIEFRSLSFAYNGSKVLKDINLTIHPGQTVGLVGKTGSGKSTIVALLTKLFKVQSGQLFIDDVDINNWKLDSLRRQIGFATQEPFLFSATVKENIQYGKTEATDAEIQLAADAGFNSN